MYKYMCICLITKTDAWEISFWILKNFAQVQQNMSILIDEIKWSEHTQPYLTILNNYLYK